VTSSTAASTGRHDPAAGRLSLVIDRLTLASTAAGTLAAVGRGLAVAGIGIVAAAAVDLWLRPSGPWAGGLAAAVAGVAAGAVSLYRTARPPQPARLRTAIAIERAHPEVAGRISRAIEFAREAPLGRPGLTAGLEETAMAAAVEAVRATGESPAGWFWRELRPATGAVLTAVMLWGGIALARGSLVEPWQRALRRQLQGLTTEGWPTEAGFSQGQPVVLGETAQEATGLLFAEIERLERVWQGDAPPPLEPLARSASATLAFWETRHEGLLVLREFAAGLLAAADAERADDVLTNLARLLRIGRAAAGVAEVAAACGPFTDRLLEAFEFVAGRPPSQLPRPTRGWLDEAADLDRRLARLLAEAGRGSIVASRAPSRPAAAISTLLGSIDVATLHAAANAIEEGRLFTAATMLDAAGERLTATARTLGMPPLARLPAQRRAVGLEQTIAALGPPPGSERAGPPPPGESARGGQPGDTTTPQSFDGDTDSGDGGTSDRRDGESGNGDRSGDRSGGAGGEAGPGVAAAGATAAGPVWIPPSGKPTPTSRQPPPVPERYHRAIERYFRRLSEPPAGPPPADRSENDASPEAATRSPADVLRSLLALVVLQVSGDASGNDKQPGPHESPPPPTAEEASRAVRRGLDWLASSQAIDGSWGSGRFAGSVAVTAHGVLAFAASGSTPRGGVDAATVDDAITFLVEASRPDGLIAGNEAAAHGPMYAHAYAILALAELLGECDRDELPAILGRGCRLIEAAQNDEGGWRYQPRPGEADSSVTAAVLVALEAAASAGVAVSQPTVERGVGYLHRLQNPDGGFRYQSAAGPSGEARTAAVLVALGLADAGESPPLRRGRAWLAANPVRPGRVDGYARYGLLATSNAAWQEGPRAWADWYRSVAGELLFEQRPDGSWADPSCPEYGTAATILSLTMANGLVPAFDRGGPR